MKSLLALVSKHIFTKISKKQIADSLILKGIQCQKLFWLEKNAPKIKKRDDASTIFAQITKKTVELKAKELFSDAVVVEKKSQKLAIAKTKEVILSGADTIIDAVFEYKGVVSKVDILQKNELGYSLYEIKSGSNAKDIHFNEVAIKWYILKNCNIQLTKSYIIHINNKCLRTKNLDIQELFVKKNITAVVKKRQNMVEKNINELLQIKKSEPKIDIGSWCNDPYECDYKSLCWKSIKTPSIFDLHKLSGKKKFELYKDNIIDFKDIPKNFELKDVQKRQIDAEINNKNFIDKKALHGFIDKIEYPIYFLDFETFQQAIPEFENLSPYEQIPFQFSLHILSSIDSKPKHIEFLAKEDIDPREKLAQKLVESIGETGTILAYNQSFEKTIIKNLATKYPQHNTILLSFLDRFDDLMKVFEQGMYYTKEMNGRHSIKMVLPALVPELSYKILNIQHGGEAMNEYALLSFKKNEKQKKQIRESLLEYCKLDTLAMVEIWKRLVGAI